MAIRTMGCIESSGSGNKDRSGNEDAPTVRFLRPFSDFQESVDIFTTASIKVISADRIQIQFQSGIVMEQEIGNE